jgi:hypothetical protein
MPLTKLFNISNSVLLINESDNIINLHYRIVAMIKRVNNCKKTRIANVCHRLDIHKQMWVFRRERDRENDTSLLNTNYNR